MQVPAAEGLVGYVCLLHTFWGVLLMLWGRDIYATPISGLLLVLPHRALLGGALVVLSAWSLWVLLWSSWPYKARMVALLPQQGVLFISTLACLAAVLHQQYADGVTRHWAFILADQLSMILLMVLYSARLRSIYFTE